MLISMFLTPLVLGQGCRVSFPFGSLHRVAGVCGPPRGADPAPRMGRIHCQYYAIHIPDLNSVAALCYHFFAFFAPYSLNVHDGVVPFFCFCLGEMVFAAGMKSRVWL